ncbi:MAG: hypothetical protein HY262_03450 [Chloroflexi bacterium]|nr:hypothetical protein [Chloroflexota bacterium]
MTADRHADDAPGHEGAVAHHLPDDHAHTDEALGPIDTAVWLAGAAGVAVGLVIAAAFALSTGAIG